MMRLSAGRNVLMGLGLIVGLVAGCKSNEPPSTQVTTQEISLLSADSCPTHAMLAGLATPSIDRILALFNAAGSKEDSSALGALGITPSLLGVVGVSRSDTAMVWRSPQYQDCQDLLAKDDTTQYVTRAGLLATALAQAPDTAYTNHPDQGLRLLLVHRLAGADYANLRLDTSLLCVYVGVNRQSDWWAAALPCSGDTVARDSVPDRRRLNVTRLIYRPFLALEDYPPVGRWEWDTHHHEQAYGVKCGAAWCVMGVDPPTIDPTRYGSTAQAVIPGWRDEQILAYYTAPADPANGEPSDLWAAIIPDSAAAHLTESQLSHGSFHMGHMQVRGRPSKYRTKYGISKPGRYEIWLDSLRHIRVTAGMTKTVALLTVNYNHLGARPIFAMRWAFTLQDENQWVPCPDGCCESNQNLMF